MSKQFLELFNSSFLSLTIIMSCSNNKSRKGKDLLCATVKIISTAYQLTLKATNGGFQSRLNSIRALNQRKYCWLQPAIDMDLFYYSDIEHTRLGVLQVSFREIYTLNRNKQGETGFLCVKAKSSGRKLSDKRSLPIVTSPR